MQWDLIQHLDKNRRKMEKKSYKMETDHRPHQTLHRAIILYIFFKIYKEKVYEKKIRKDIIRLNEMQLNMPQTQRI